jgi:hypothetical protein
MSTSSKSMDRKLITFRMLKKICFQTDYDFINRFMVCNLLPIMDDKCCQKNCPVWKNLRSAK